MADLRLERLVSMHGVSLEVPEGWSCLEEDLGLDRDRLAVFYDAEPVGAFAENVVITEAHVRSDVATWWASICAMLDLPLLLDVTERDDGWDATVAHVADDRSLTCRSRIVELPGRTLYLSATSPSVGYESREDVFVRILDSFACRGMP